MQQLKATILKKSFFYSMRSFFECLVPSSIFVYFLFPSLRNVGNSPPSSWCLNLSFVLRDLPCLLAKPVHRPNNFTTISPSSWWWGWGGECEVMMMMVMRRMRWIIMSTIDIMKDKRSAAEELHFLVARNLSTAPFPFRDCCRQTPIPTWSPTFWPPFRGPNPPYGSPTANSYRLSSDLLQQFVIIIIFLS